MTHELTEKLTRIRRMLASESRDALHVAQLGNLAWLLGGADLAVSLVNPPVAEAIVTHRRVVIVASSVERGRLETEELPEGVDLEYFDWHDPNAKNAALRDAAGSDRALTDTTGGLGLTTDCTRDLWPLRVPLLDAEIDRYRTLCRDASRAFTDVLSALEPGLTEHRIAGRLAAALRTAGMQPVVLLVGSDDRFERYRHPIPQDAIATKRVLAVACARRHGLIANVSRIVSFGPQDAEHARSYDALLEIEHVILRHTRHGILAREAFRELQDAYATHGHPGGWTHHHQGGPTGYVTRDFIANPHTDRPLVERSAYAWNPSLPSAKLEDTILLDGDRLEIMTEDDRWPLRDVHGTKRPLVLEL